MKKELKAVCLYNPLPSEKQRGPDNSDEDIYTGQGLSNCNGKRENRIPYSPEGVRRLSG
jgi:hypothetical protein